MRRGIAGAALAWLLGAGVARADDDTTTTSHSGQFGASLRMAYGWRGIVTYDDVDYCGELSGETGSGNAAVCLGRSPFAFDLELSYGFLPRKEVTLEFRLGLERDFGRVNGAEGPRVHFLSPGVRFFFSEEKRFKLFTTLQVVVDFTGYDDAGGQSRGTDFGVRNLTGLWFDLHRAYGLCFFVSETVTFKRWLAGELALGIGIQGRYP